MVLYEDSIQLQQYLPFTVLKPVPFPQLIHLHVSCNSTYRLRYWNRSTSFISGTGSFGVATVLTVYGIETEFIQDELYYRKVATVLTVYGIETIGAIT